MRGSLSYHFTSLYTKQNKNNKNLVWTVIKAAHPFVEFGTFVCSGLVIIIIDYKESLANVMNASSRASAPSIFLPGEHNDPALLLHHPAGERTLHPGSKATRMFSVCGKADHPTPLPCEWMTKILVEQSGVCFSVNVQLSRTDFLRGGAMLSYPAVTHFKG